MLEEGCEIKQIRKLTGIIDVPDPHPKTISLHTHSLVYAVVNSRTRDIYALFSLPNRATDYRDSNIQSAKVINIKTGEVL